jgi:hypothetical protein
MQPRFCFSSPRLAFGAAVLLCLSFLIPNLAFAAENTPGRQAARFHERPHLALYQNSGRQASPHRFVAQTASTSSVNTASSTAPISPESEFETFVNALRDGRSNVLRGVYVPGVLALRVVQQAPGNANQVNLAPGTTTQYQAAAAWGVTGLLADDAASGTRFYALVIGQEVRLVFGDGNVRTYHVSALYRYQALSPNDPYSNFVDLADGATLSAIDLFNRVYAGADHVTFQTCIAHGGLLSWGRLFVIATPN